MLIVHATPHLRKDRCQIPKCTPLTTGLWSSSSELTSLASGNHQEGVVLRSWAWWQNATGPVEISVAYCSESTIFGSGGLREVSSPASSGEGETTLDHKDKRIEHH